VPRKPREDVAALLNDKKTIIVPAALIYSH
jgi:hypothetical protein